MAKIHSSSVISKDVELAEDVEVGPFCILRGKIKIDSGTKVEGHVTLGSDSSILEIGKNNIISHGASLGGPPQDINYKGEVGKLTIGNNNQIKEFVTISIGTAKGGGITKIGNDCLIMTYVHLGHDVKVGNGAIIANLAQIAGHTEIGKKVYISGCVAIGQNIRIGEYAFIGGDSAINKDILPYTIAQGNFATCRAVNKIGISRSGFSEELIDNIHKAIRIILMGSTTMQEGILRIEKECTQSEEIKYLIQFIRDSKKGIAK